MGRRRVSASRLIVWREALGELRRHARILLGAAAVIVGGLLVINLYPGVPGWEAGFVTGGLTAFFVGFSWWVAFVPSGLVLRGMGPLAEQWTAEALSGAPGVLGVVPSLKFDRRDVDHVVVARAGIVAVETKWRSNRVDDDELRRCAEQAARVGRTLRLSLRRNELPEALFSVAVVIWGPGGRDLVPREIITGLGAVTVMGGHQTDEWLRRLARGPVGADYAESLQQELHALAVRRDSGVPAGPVLRWLARAR
jgi:hypothetical protein